MIASLWPPLLQLSALHFWNWHYQKSLFYSAPTFTLLYIGTLEKRPLGSLATKLLTLPSKPLLITSHKVLELNNDPIPKDRHLRIVDKVVKVISHSENNEEEMEKLLSDDSRSLQEPEDDMILSQYQKDIKLKVIARRKPSKKLRKRKKREKISPSLVSFFSSFYVLDVESLYLEL